MLYGPRSNSQTDQVDEREGLEGELGGEGLKGFVLAKPKKPTKFVSDTCGCTLLTIREAVTLSQIFFSKTADFLYSALRVYLRTYIS